MELPRMAKVSTEPLLTVYQQLHSNHMPVGVHALEAKVPWDLKRDSKKVKRKELVERSG
jgi:hypothetical protein